MRVFLLLLVSYTNTIIFMISYLSQEISSTSDIYWFESSNKYVIVDKKFSKILTYKLTEENNDKFIKKARLSLNLVDENFEEISNQMNEFINECTRTTTNQILKTDMIDKDFDLEVSYTFNNRTINVKFDSDTAKNLIHPKFSHLQTDEKYEVSAELIIFSQNNTFFLFKDKDCIGGWSKDNMHEFQGKFSMELISSFYDKIENDWMGVFHASAVAKNSKAIMLTGDSGAGKSSLTTLLTESGYNFISDDFTPMLLENSLIYSFPSAISIKESFFDEANSIFNGFKELKSIYVNDIKGWVKYLPPKHQNSGSFKCNSVIHVKYDRKASNRLLKIDNSVAIQQLLPDAWIASSKNHAKKFITWITNTNFYSLNYSDNTKAINLINKLI